MPSRGVGVVAALLAFALLPTPSLAKSEPGKEEIARQIRFGAEMARQGNWREAIFRWQRVLAVDPANPRLHNNLAVAWESLGEYDKAEAEYKAALSSTKVPDEVRRNEELFRRFYVRYKQREAAPEGGAKGAEEGGGKGAGAAGGP